MSVFGLEHGRAAYAADFAFYALLISAMAALLVVDTSRGQWPLLCAWSLLGVLLWTLMEYLLHRFLLHQVQPFRRWHLEHHERPGALIATPTTVTAVLFLILVFLPAQQALDLPCGTALTGGILIGFLGFSIAHHAVHHWRGQGAWFRRRKTLHALHHHGSEAQNFGVTTDVWDRVFGTLSTR